MGSGTGSWEKPKGRIKKTIAPDVAIAWRGKLAKNKKEGFRAHLHSYPWSALLNPSVSL